MAPLDNRYDACCCAWPLRSAKAPDSPADSGNLARSEADFYDQANSLVDATAVAALYAVRQQTKSQRHELPGPT